MDVTIKQIVMELLRDAKSRKFLLVLGFGGLIVAGNYYGWTVSKESFYTLAGLVGLYLVVEGLADVVGRWKGN